MKNTNPQNALHIFFIVLVVFSFSSCQNAEDKNPADQSVVENVNTNEEGGVKDSVDELTQFRLDYTISNIPAPMEIINDINLSGSNYHKELLNSVKNTNNYITASKRALNIGVFGADLSYEIIYGQPQEAITYLKAINVLAQNMGISNVFNKDDIEKYGQYIGNKDSLNTIIYDVYDKVDRKLRTNERIGLAGMVLTGGWVESMYIALNTLNKQHPNNKLLLKRIIENKVHLKNLMGVLSKFQDQKDYAALMLDLTGLQKLYEPISSLETLKDEDIEALKDRVSFLRRNIVD
jgi:hypothetical protein